MDTRLNVTSQNEMKIFAFYSNLYKAISQKWKMMEGCYFLSKFTWEIYLSFLTNFHILVKKHMVDLFYKLEKKYWWWHETSLVLQRRIHSSFIKRSTNLKNYHSKRLSYKVLSGKKAADNAGPNHMIICLFIKHT